MAMADSHTNRLIKEKSPYLLQHAHNPVDWYPWGPEAFEKAKREDRPVFLSVGYSTCHWCHVMERESFENPDIAKILNEHFVSIKVDREERPDLDNIYMTAVVSMIGQGGWPLSVFLTPDKKPFYGGTYFPPQPRFGSPGFSDLLLTISDSWKNKKSEILESSQAIVGILQGRLTAEEQSAADLNGETLKTAYNLFSRSFDSRFGGFGQAPKFPSGHNLSFLLRYWKKSSEPKALEMVAKTLSEMAKGGIYDHLGGGFHRYSTDQYWHVPHFEKMLYDQAILARAYLEAYQATKNEGYARVAREVFDYILRDMTDAKGGFYCAEDADSLMPDADSGSGEKKEGAFYVWSQEEIESLLGKENAEIACHYFGVELNGNAQNDPHGEFIGKNILFLAHGLGETAEHFKKTEAEIKKAIEGAKEKLFAARVKRPKPHLDDKILTDWNGLMISSLAFGSRVLNEPRYQVAARRAADFLLENLMRQDGRLLHRYRDGESAILGNLDDYAFFVSGLIDLYEATFDVRYLKQAKQLTQEMIRLFWDKSRDGFFLTAADAEELIMRPKEIYDGAIPSGNAVAASDLLKLAHMTLEMSWQEKAQRIFSVFSHEVARYPSGYAQLLVALDFALGPAKEIIIAGDEKAEKTIQALDVIFKMFLPNKVVVFRPSDERKAQEIIQEVPFIKEQAPFKNDTTIYVCENNTCKFPTVDLHTLKNILEQK